MGLSALILCSDEKIVRVVRRVLADLDIQAECCSDSSAALRKLTRQRFEALIVDCSEVSFREVLRSARSAPGNGRAIAIAIADPALALKAAFDLGAHFVLYKPVSSERAKLSFRAARALMKTERRRNTRIPVRIPVLLESGRGSHHKLTTEDLGEGGMAVSLPTGQKPSGVWKATFTLPDSTPALEVTVELAWEGRERQGGLRFVSISAEVTSAIQAWMKRSSPDLEPDDPPLAGRLSDLTPHACYVDISTPLPVSTQVTVSMSEGKAQLKVTGVVRVMHPERGIGIQFAHSAEGAKAVEKWLAGLGATNASPEVLIEPQGLVQIDRLALSASAEGDPLLQLYNDASIITPESFFDRLRLQRTGAAPVADSTRAQAASGSLA
jgi:CheY-like chemotaxis protein